jgi:hypothetical protein
MVQNLAFWEQNQWGLPYRHLTGSEQVFFAGAESSRPSQTGRQPRIQLSFASRQKMAVQREGGAHSRERRTPAHRRPNTFSWMRSRGKPAAVACWGAAEDSVCQTFFAPPTLPFSPPQSIMWRTANVGPEIQSLLFDFATFLLESGLKLCPKGVPFVS